MWMRMSQAILLLAVLSAPVAATPGEQAKVYGGEPVVSLELSADRERYFVGQPVGLTLRARNDGSDALIGFFAMNLRDYARTELSYRRPAGASRRFKVLSDRDEARAQARDVIFSPVLLEPNASKSSRVQVIFDAGEDRLLLDQPGDYEFVVSLHAAHGRLDHALTSNVLTVRVDAVPDKEREAFAEYQANALPFLVPSAAKLLGYDKAMIQGAGQFVQRHAGSVYAEAVRKGLLRSLRPRVLQNRATKEQKALFERLKESDDGDDDWADERIANQERQERELIEHVERILKQREAGKPKAPPSPRPEG